MVVEFFQLSLLLPFSPICRNFPSLHTILPARTVMGTENNTFQIPSVLKRTSSFCPILAAVCVVQSMLPYACVALTLPRHVPDVPVGVFSRSVERHIDNHTCAMLHCCFVTLQCPYPRCDPGFTALATLIEYYLPDARVRQFQGMGDEWSQRILVP